MRFPHLTGPAILSPMAGVTDVAFRALAKRYGCAMTCTQFVSSAALVRHTDSAKRLLVTDPLEKPVAVQLFGSSVEEVVAAARIVEDDFDVIDINCGCPAWKVIKTGAGARMLERPEGIASFVGKLASAVHKPVTIKIRSGPDAQHINAVEVARLAEDAGAAAIAIHGRTAAQDYSSIADWDIIKRVKEAVAIPVIGNGDVFTPETFQKHLEESGVDAIMVARGAIGNPHLFAEIDSFLTGGSYMTMDRVSQFLDYLPLAKRYHIPFPTVKQHAITSTKGIPGGARLREKLATAKSTDELLVILK